MAGARDELLAAVERGADALLAMVREAEPFALLQQLSSRELDRLWDAVGAHVDAALEAASPILVDAEDAPEELDEAAVDDALRVLHAAAVASKACALDTDREAPKVLLDTTVKLHDIIFDISDQRASYLQAAIVEMCESWWLAERPGREALAPQLITYLTMKTLHESASGADIKRLYACRGALRVLDYADECILPLKNFLLHCAIKPQVLRSTEGRKFVVHLFSLHPPFILELHRAIKAQLPVCRKSLRAIYGEIYFKAWRAASGPYLAKMEESVLQDLMWHALHASSTAMATTLQQVLAYTHEQKRQRGVDAMLLNLYQPIIWRALNAANPHVRRNAAAIFVETFPLQDPSKSNVDQDELMQLQFDTLQTLLKDDAIAVRVGVCRVLALFWEMIPTPTTRSLLALLVSELAHDASANLVRVAVFQGLKFLIANAATASVASQLKSTWGSLASLINDGSERVRSSMLDFLIEATKMRSLHWQYLIKPETLLARLPTERPELQLRLTRLLLPLYLPQGRSAAQQLSRLTTLLKEFPQAGMLMLKHSPSFASSESLVKLLRLLLGVTLSTATPAELISSDKISKLTPRTEQLPRAELVAFCGGMATLFDALGPSLAQSTNSAASALLVEQFNATSMAMLEEAAQPSNAAQRSLMVIAAWLPAEAVPNLSRDCLKELAKLPEDAVASQISPLLQCAIAWQQDGAFLDQVTRSLSGEEDSDAGSKRGRQTKGRSARSKKVVEPEECSFGVCLALRVLWSALANASTRTILLERQLIKLEGLLQVLANPPKVHANETERMLMLSCSLQLSWHLAASRLAAAKSAPVNVRRGRVFQQTQALQEEEAAQAIALSRTILSDALSRAFCDAPNEHVLVPLTGRCNTTVEESPGEARPKVRARTSHGRDVDGDEPVRAVETPRLSLRALVMAWSAEGCTIGLFDRNLAESAVAFTNASLRLARTAVGVANTTPCPLDQLLPHASKLTVQLFELAGTTDTSAVDDSVASFYELGCSVLFSILGVGVTSSDGMRSLRALLLEVMALVQLQGGEQVTQLLRQLLQFVVNAMPPQNDEPLGTGGGVQALGLPRVAAEVLEVLLLRSSGCTVEFLPCAQQLLRANHAAPATAHRCLRLLLACDQLHKASQPGLAAFKRHLHSMLHLEPESLSDVLHNVDENQDGTSDADSQVQNTLLVHSAEMLLSALA